MPIKVFTLLRTTLTWCWNGGCKSFPFKLGITLPLETSWRNQLGSVINVQIAHDPAQTVLRLRFPSPSKETGSEIGAIVCQVMNEHGNFTFAGSYASRRTNTGRRDGNDHRNQILWRRMHPRLWPRKTEFKTYIITSSVWVVSMKSIFLKVA